METGATITGSWPPGGCTFNSSRVVRNGRFVFLVIDKLNQAPLTSERATRWVEELERNWGLAP